MKAKSIKGKSVSEIQFQLESSLSDEFNPSIAFLFVTGKIDWQKARNLLDKKGIDVFGAITPPAFDDKEILTEGIVILLLDINPDFYKIVLQDNQQNSLSESVSRIGKIGKDSFSNPAFLIAVSDLRNSGDEIIKQFIEVVGKDIVIMGGFSGNPQTWHGEVFTNKSSSSDGIISLILDQEKVDVKGVAISGWQAVGTDKTVTESEGNWMLAIDNQPAVEVLKKFVGKQIIDDSGSETMIKIDTTTYVLQSKREGDSPAFIATLEYDTKRGGILCSTPIKVGTKFRFSLPPDFEVVDRVIETASRLKENELPEADALIVFSCIGRHITLGPLAESEIKGLSETWEIPTAGFFSLGEFGRVEGGRPEYHGTTCSWVALKEK